MSEFTRLAIVGKNRRLDLVVPTDEPFAALLPRMLDLLADPDAPSSEPLGLCRIDGESVELAMTAADQQIADGETLHLVPLDEAPPPPEVSDITDVVGAELDARTDLWRIGIRRGAVLVLLALIAVVCGDYLVAMAPVLGAEHMLPGEVAGALPGAVAIACGLAAAIAALVGRGHGRWFTHTMTALALGLCWPGASVLTGELDWLARTPAAPASVTVILAWLVIGLGLGLGCGVRAALWGSSLGLVAGLVPVALVAAGLSQTMASGIIGIAAMAMVGLLPWLAMSSAGLAALDDQVLAGDRLPRSQVTGIAAEAYRTLTWACAAVLIPIAIAGSVLVADADPWAIALGLVLAAVVALRARTFAIVWQPLMCWAAVAVIAASAAQNLLGSWILPAALAGVVVVLIALGGLDPAAHVRARLRRIANVCEAICVASTVPLLIGVAGIYPQLLGTFR